jgi:hypothetical protein
MPDNSRIWIYAADRPLSQEEIEYTCARLNNFISSWKAHGTQLNANYTLVYNRFVIIAVDESGQNATGCSIDACVGEMKDISKKLDVDFFNRFNIVYRDSDNDLVVSANVSAFKEMIENGDIHPESVVFDNTVQTVGDLFSKWETMAKNTWMARYFKKIAG